LLLTTDLFVTIIVTNQMEVSIMNASSRFAVAVHVLLVLHINKFLRGFDATTSDFIADSVNTNAVVIRRILGMLRKAGLVMSQTGVGGGSSLAKSSEQISLEDIRVAVEDGPLFHLHYSDPDADCPIGASIQDELGGVIGEAEVALRKVLGEKTLAALADKMIQSDAFQTRMKARMAEMELDV
jgi:DNA-binding IscR family transcriptional regulator